MARRNKWSWNINITFGTGTLLLWWVEVVVAVNGAKINLQCPGAGGSGGGGTSGPAGAPRQLVQVLVLRISRISNSTGCWW